MTATVPTGRRTVHRAWMTAGALCLGAPALCLAVPRRPPYPDAEQVERESAPDVG